VRDDRYACVTEEGVASDPGTVEVFDLEQLRSVASVDVGQQAAGIGFWKTETGTPLNNVPPPHPLHRSSRLDSPAPVPHIRERQASRLISRWLIYGALLPPKLRDASLGTGPGGNAAD
jgi:hypothetical protein